MARRFVLEALNFEGNKNNAYVIQSLFHPKPLHGSA
jgi:hypothetical protein